jgi:large subunit ribosomal protein L46
MPAAAEPVVPAASQSTTSPSPAARSLYRIKSGVILTRAPLLTRQLTPFEAAFFLYQKRLNERLSAPFRRAQYFKTDTASDLDFRLKLRGRRGVAGRDIGLYKPVGRDAWNDEVKVGSRLSDPAAVVENIVRDAEMRVSEDGEELSAEDRVHVERPLPRTTEADEKGDVRRLDRRLDRTLYLVVQGKDGKWEFPTGDVLTSENLHEVSAALGGEGVCIHGSQAVRANCGWPIDCSADTG